MTEKEKILNVQAVGAAHQSRQFANIDDKAHRVRFWQQGDVDALEGGAELKKSAEEEEKYATTAGIHPRLQMHIVFVFVVFVSVLHLLYALPEVGFKLQYFYI